MMDALLSMSMITDTVAPRAARIAADQKISPHRAGRKSRPPIRDPSTSWNGSSMVT